MLGYGAAYWLMFISGQAVCCWRATEMINTRIDENAIMTTPAREKNLTLRAIWPGGVPARIGCVFGARRPALIGVLSPSILLVGTQPGPTLSLIYSRTGTRDLCCNGVH